jgi:hypothetical protein
MRGGMLLNKSNSKTDICPPQYFCYIVAASYWWKKPECPVNTTELSQVSDKLHQIQSNVVWSISPMNRVRTHNFSGDRHILHRYWQIQLPYDHGHDGPLENVYSTIIPLKTRLTYALSPSPHLNIGI